jgi:hypothetical protein
MRPPVFHCAINADDVEASRRFYAAAFGWTFEPWGPPGFLRMESPSGQFVALQQRRNLGDVRLNGFECTVAVPDLDAFLDAVGGSGGRVLMERATIPGVGDLAFCADPSGIAFGAMQFVAQ